MECIHLNGGLYYFNSERHIVTPHNVNKPDILQAVLQAMEDHRAWVKTLRKWPERDTWPRCVDNLDKLEHVVFAIDGNSGPRNRVYHISYDYQRKVDFADGSSYLPLARQSDYY